MAWRIWGPGLKTSRGLPLPPSAYRPGENQEINLRRRRGPSPGRGSRTAGAVRGRPPAAAAGKAADLQDPLRGGEAGGSPASGLWTPPHPVDSAPALPEPVFLIGWEVI